MSTGAGTFQLARGAVKTYMQATDSGNAGLPTGTVLQITGIKPVQSKAGAPTAPEQERFRVSLSDGEHSLNSIFSTQLTSAIHSGKLKRLSVLRIDNSMTNIVQDRKIPIIIAATSLGDAPDRIGNPTLFSGPTTPGVTNPAAQQQQQQHQQAPQGAGSGGAQPPAGMVRPGAMGSAPGGQWGGQQQPPQQQQQQHQQPQQNQYNRPPAHQQQQQQSYQAPQNQQAAYQPQPVQQQGGPGYGSSSFYAQPGSRPHYGGAAGASSAAGGAHRSNVQAIAALSPYSQAWTIRGRVTVKGDMRHWNNQRGEGKLFSFTMADDSMDIRVTAFNAEADKFYDMLQQGKVYVLSNGRVKQAQAKWNNTKCPYEVSLDGMSVLEECSAAEAAAVPTLKLDVKPLADLANVEANALVDVLVIATDLGQTNTFVSKTTQREMTKRDITVVDQSGYSVRLTLWGRTAEQPGFHEGQVLGISRVKVGDFGGRSLSSLSSSIITVNPDIPEAHQLLGWYEQGGKNSMFQSFQGMAGGGGAMGMGGGGFGANGGAGGRGDDLRQLAEMQDPNIGVDKPEYYSCEAYVTYVRTNNMTYPACPTSGCNKKVIPAGDNAWRCEKCNAEYERPEYRYIASVSAADASGQVWLQLFNDAAAQVFGKSADELHYLQTNDEAAAADVLKQASFRPFRFRVRAKQDTFNDESRVRHSVVDVKPIDGAASFIEAARAARNTIQSYAA